MNTTKNKPGTRITTENKDGKDADSLRKQKCDLKREIEELQNLIWQVEANRDTTVFGDATNTENLSLFREHRHLPREPPNLDDVFAKEIFKYSGFYCEKLTKSEYTINFFSYGNCSSAEKFFIELLNGDGKVSLGKWAMPMSADAKSILSATPLNSSSSIIPFVKNCKRHVDSYGVRKNQYYELKQNISEFTNCDIETNFGFTEMILQLSGVRHKPKDIFLNLILYLSYKSEEATPTTINVDWSLKKDLTDVEIKQIKSYAKCFKINTLLEGLTSIDDAVNPIYEWRKDVRVESPLNLSCLSDFEDESFLKKVKKKRKRISASHKKIAELKKRLRKRRSVLSLSEQKENSRKSETNVGSSNEYNSREKMKETRNKKKSDKLRQLISKRASNNSNFRVETIEKNSATNQKRKLRQTTLNFENNVEIYSKTKAEEEKAMDSLFSPRVETAESQRSMANESRKERTSKVASLRFEVSKKRGPGKTSTPLKKKLKNTLKLKRIKNLEISCIGSENED